MTIPARVHFCWIGPTLPWAYVFAVLSAAARSGMDEVILHHTDALAEGPEIRALRAAARVRLSRIDPAAYLAAVERAAGITEGRLSAFYQSVPRPVQRADILRVAILYREGGVYLDLDTITVASFRPLLGAAQFVGTEFIVWPQAVCATRDRRIRARHTALAVLRRVLRTIPLGWKLFRRVTHLYCRGMNNAAMGAQAGSPFFATCLRHMLAMSPQERVRPYALGPHLLDALAACGESGTLTVHDPAIFYPMPPEISEHLFRRGRHVRAQDVLQPGTCVVHWYASVRTKQRVARITPRSVQADRERQLFSALVSMVLETLPDED
ncbi:glycosyltransferase [Nguyenibacter vanlangensis]|uniref:Glycosyl transferase n=1 Tax=Nguyenibacter vanlangensis TaxID=1216886 RepID=A0A7Y7IXL2_9PROT|nr:glycosyltransferase [Nguyenibacter vanlangensis]NVN11670.1 glycosyl transferase [Nguyenibacter vanlangensis]